MSKDYAIEGIVNGTDTGISSSDAVTSDSTIQLLLNFFAPGALVITDSFTYFDPTSDKWVTGSQVVGTYQLILNPSDNTYDTTVTVGLPTQGGTPYVIHNLSADLTYIYSTTNVINPPADPTGSYFSNLQHVVYSGVQNANYTFHFHDTLQVTVDQTAPTVQSFDLDRNRSAVDYTDSINGLAVVSTQTLTYDLTFSENVYGLNPSDLTIRDPHNQAPLHAFIKSVTLDPNYAGTAQANAHYLVTFDTGQTPGVLQIVYAGTGGTDAAGNLSQSFATSEAVEIAKPFDTTPPSTPDLVFASDTGTSGTDNLTADTTPSFIGTSKAGETIELFVDGTLAATTVATPSGVWNATVLTPLSAGQHQITAEAFGAGQHSGVSNPLVITIDPSQGDAGSPGAFQPEIHASNLSSGQGFNVAAPASSSFLGAEIAAAGDLNGDGYADIAYSVLVGNPDGMESGRVYVEYGSANGLANVSLGSLGSHGFEIDGLFAGSGNTITVASAGDVNGDGIDDLIVGEPGTNLNGQVAVGDAYVIYGSKGGPTNVDVAHLTPQQGYAIHGSTPYGGLGISVASAGDFNGDGIDDVIVGALDINGVYGSGAGGTYIVYGKLGTASNPTIDVGALTATSGLHIITPTDENGRHNYQVGALGDVNGDGYADVAITIGNDGLTYVVFGHATSPGDAASFDVSDLNGTNGFTFGTSTYDIFDDGQQHVVAAGDINHDGYADILVSGPADTAYVIFGHAGAFAANIQKGNLNGANGFVITNSHAAGDRSLSVVGHAGDVNGDGIDDLVVGDPTHNGGQAYVILGHQGGWGNIDVAGLNGANGFAVDLAQANNFNLTVTGLGDVNGDGRADLGFATSDQGEMPSTNASVLLDVMSAAPSRLATTSDTGIGGNGNVTSNTTPTVTGAAEYGATVKVYIDGMLAGTALTTPEAGASLPTGETWTFTVPTILADGTHVFTATATDAAGNVSPASAPLSITVDTTAPTASSLTLLGQAVTNATSLNYSLALSDPVVGIELGDFSVAASGPSGAKVTGFTALNADANGAASRYQVTVATGSGDGTVTLSYTSAHGTDIAGNPLALTTITSSATTIDKTAPAVLTTTAAGAVGAAAADFTVTFSEAVQGVDANDFALSHTGTAGASLSVSALSSTVYDVHLSDISGTGSLVLALAPNAVIADAVGNPIAPSATTLATHAVDRDAPAKPAVTGFSPDSDVVGDHLTNAPDVVLTGKAEAGSAVTIYAVPYRPDFYVGDDQLPFNYSHGYSIATYQTTVADGAGNWTVTTPALHDTHGSSYYFWATATDAAGNTSIESDAFAVQVDQTPPVATVTRIQGADTNLDLVGYSVTFSEPVSGITTDSFALIANGPTSATIESVTASDATHYVVTVATGSGDGTLQLVSTGGTDAAGNVASVSYGDTYTVDRTPPGAPPQVLLFKFGGVFTNQTIGDVTNVNHVTIVPLLGHPYTTFYVYDGDTLLGTANYESSFGFYDLSTTLSDGTHALTVRAVDAAGNIGAPSVARTVVVDTQAPATPAAPTLDSGSDSGVSNSDDITRVVQPKFIGTTEAFSTVTLHDADGSVIGRGTADAAGNYSIVSSPLSHGDHTVTVTATDKAGNTSGSSEGLTVHIVLEPHDDTQTIVNSVKVDAGIAQGSVTSLLANDLGGPNDHLVVTGIHAGPTGADVAVDPTNGAMAAGTYGTLFVKQDGTWTFTPNADFDNLPVGTAASDLFTYTMSDGAGHSATATLTLNEPAANTAPVIEAAGTTASGHANAAEYGPNLVQNGDFEQGLLDWGYSGTVSAGGGGVGGSSSAQLFADQRGSTLTDGFFLSDGSWYQITFSAANDDPGAAPANLSFGWYADHNLFVGLPASFMGQWTLQPGQDYTTYSVALPGYAISTFQFVADVQDGAAPVHLDNISVQQIVETQSSMLSGTIAFNDPDDTPVAAFTPEGTGYLGTFALGDPARDGASGDGTLGWTFNFNGWDSIRYLGAGQSISQSYDVTLTDDRNSVAHQTVTVTLTGANDPPSITGLAEGGIAASITDAQTIQPFATVTISDPDTTDIEHVTLTFNNGFGTLSNLGGGTFDAATGSYTTAGSAASVTADLRGLVFTPAANLDPAAFDNSAYQNGFIGVHFNLSVSDGSATANAVTGDQITQVDDPPVITSTAEAGSIDLRLAPAFSSLLVNGAFETGDLTGWTLTKSATAPSPSVTTNNPHDGNYAFDFAPGTNGDVTLSQTVAVQPGINYELSWWSDNSFANVGQTRLGVMGTGRPTAVATDARGYTEYVEFLHDAAFGNTAVTSTTLNLGVFKTNSSDNRVTHVDGVSLKPVTFAATTGGTITFADPDPNAFDEATATPHASGYLGTLAFDYSDLAHGNIGWTFSLDSQDAAALAAGQPLTQTYDVSIGDGQVAPAATTITVTITGANDAPTVFSASGPGIVGPSAGVAVTTRDTGLLWRATDPDPGDAALLKIVSAAAAGVPGTTPVLNGEASVAGLYGTLTLHDDGTYSYMVDPAKLAGVDRHQMANETFYYTAADPHGASSTAALTIQVFPHQAPIVTAQTATADVTHALTVAAANGLLSGTTDPDGDHPEVSHVAVTTLDGITHNYDVHGLTTIEGVYGELVVGPDGSYSYTPRADAAASGQHATETFTFTVEDGWLVAAGDPTSTLTIDVTNYPVHVAPVAGIATEDGPSATLDALARASSDNPGATLSVVNLPAALPAGVTYDAATHAFTLDPANAAYQPLAAGETTTVSVGYGITDGANTAGGSVSWTVTGVNDPAIIGGDLSRTLTEGDTAAAISTTGKLTSSDIDGTPNAFTAATLAGQYGTLVLSANGAYSYTASSAHTEFVGGQTYTDTFGVTAADGTPANIAIHIAGTDSTSPQQPSSPPAQTAAPVIGTGGSDTFTVPTGNSNFIGDGGIDTAVFNFKLTDAHVAFVGNEVIVDTASSHTVLNGISIYQFTDGTVNEKASGDPLVDPLFYYSQNHDVWTAGVDAAAHYHTVGWHEGRDPDAFFDTATYLSLNPSVKASGVDPLTQFEQGGWKTSDPSINFDINAYLKANPDVAVAGVDPLVHFLQNGEAEGRQPIAPATLVASNGFDYVYYLQHNPDVAAAHVDPLQHYESVGWKEGRNPNAYFDVNGYLAHNPDVAAAGVNPLDQYHQYGWQEGRDPSPNFDTTAYLAAYPDVAAAHVDPLLQYLQHGIAEGRTAHADGMWG